MPSDTFNRADGPLGANWTQGFSHFAGDLGIVSNAAKQLQGAPADRNYFWGASGFPIAQFSEIVVGVSPTFNDWIGANVRTVVGGEGYLVILFQGDAQLYTMAGGLYTLLTSQNLSYASGGVLRLMASGTNPVHLEVRYNGLVVFGFDDSTHIPVLPGSSGIAAAGISGTIVSWFGDTFPREDADIAVDDVGSFQWGGTDGMGD